MRTIKLVFFFFIPSNLFAASLPAVPSSLELSPILVNFLCLSLLSFIPGILIMLSSFTRIIVVLSLLRTALGLQQTPPNSVLISLALFLTGFTMMPVIEKVYQYAYLPYQENKIDLRAALNKAKKPLHFFMLQQTREQDLLTILNIAQEPLPQKSQDIKFFQLVPAFLLSELQAAFQIGFIIFLPFLLIDLIVSSLLMTLGMMMMPPTTLSLPLKILVFVLIDGWDLIAQSLIASFH